MPVMLVVFANYTLVAGIWQVGMMLISSFKTELNPINLKLLT